MSILKVESAVIGGREMDTVIAQDVHKALGGYTAYAGWLSYRLKGFTEGVDYSVAVVAQNGKKEYRVSLPMALSMARTGRTPCQDSVVEFIYSLLPTASVTAVAKQPVFNAPAHLASVKTMSSVEIVDVINALRGLGKAELRHDHFMEKIDGHPGINGPNFRGVYLGGNGESRPCYYLPKREAELMVMSESLEVQTRVYDRLAELEQAVAPKLPQSYAEALMELAMTVQRTEALQLDNAAKATQIVQQTMLIEHQQPAVEFVEKYVESDGLKTFRQVAKLLGAKEMEFRNFMADRKIQYRLGGDWTHNAKYGETGSKCFITKTGMNSNSGKQFTYSYFTAKGVEWITRLWNERTPMLTRKMPKFNEDKYIP